MAKSKTNKSAAIREFLKGNRKAQAQQVIDALAVKGVNVNAGLVYAVKQQVRGKRRRRIAAVAVASKNTRNGEVDPVKLIQETKALSQKAGGIRKLQELLAALE